MIEVIATGEWQPHHGIVGTQTGSVGRVTKFVIDGVICYVRENFCKANSFEMSANARMGLKKGGVNGSTQILELIVPKGDWSAVADQVSAIDPLKRPVRRNRNFTVRWAESALMKPSK